MEEILRFVFLYIFLSLSFLFSFLIATFGKGERNTWSRGGENETGKKTAVFVLKNPLEGIPVSYCCASMEAGSAAPSL